MISIPVFIAIIIALLILFIIYLKMVNKIFKIYDKEIADSKEINHRLRYEYTSLSNRVQTAAQNSDCLVMFNDEDSLKAMSNKIEQLQKEIMEKSK